MTNRSPKEPSINGVLPSESYYGDEAQRFAELKALDYDAFKEQLLGIRNNLDNETQEQQFVTSTNGNIGGGLYPRPEDKNLLLKHTLEQAQSQDNVQDAALVLATGIVFTHPFYDGNGRTSRITYGYYSRGIGYEDQSFEARVLRSGLGGDLIEFGDQIDGFCGRMIDILVYAKEEFEPIASSSWYLSQDEEAAKRHYSLNREYTDLSADEAKELDALLGEKHGIDGDDPGRYASNSKAITYGFSKIAHEYDLDLPIWLHQEEGKNPWSQVIVPDALAVLSGDQKRRLTTYIRDYNTKYARSAIDMITDHGDEVITYDGMRIAVRDLIIEKTKNYLASSKFGSRLEEIRERVKRDKAQR